MNVSIFRGWKVRGVGAVKKSILLPLLTMLGQIPWRSFFYVHYKLNIRYDGV
ncbi:hypothetical protein [Priestia koreensis]|nr:hypothetical protein [Priestia koreensis]UNL83822.1 hypothetical protein IE339_16860 [Priestia koreensis]